MMPAFGAEITGIAVLAFGFSVMATPALGQSNCRQAKGELTGAYDAVTNTTTGTITNAGWLNGTTLEAFAGVVLPTPDPTTVSFIGEFTLATIHR